MMDELFSLRDKSRVWEKYCGFLHLSLDEFMEIQEQLLLEEINLIFDSDLGRTLMPKKPKTVSEFRQFVPLTTYADYAPVLAERDEAALGSGPYTWAITSGRGGTTKWVPYTDRGLRRLGMFGVGVIILACARRMGDVNVGSGTHVLYNVPPPPYSSGLMARLVPELMGAKAIPPPDKYENVDFEIRVRDGFQIALRTGVDVLGSLSAVLVRMGERFAQSSGTMQFGAYMLYPQTAWRLARAFWRSKKEGRALLPKDLWPLKGLIGFGMDTGIYRDKIVEYWGAEPLEAYACTEFGGIAVQAPNKKSMTFVPYSCFLEFIPEDEWLRSRQEQGYQPSTVLLDQVQPGNRYEVVFTSFYGMPFLRYRIGDLVRVVALEDGEIGVNLPQIVFDARADDLIDIAGFTRLDERTVWQAIAETGVAYEDWTIRKEFEDGKPSVHLYIELKGDVPAERLQSELHSAMSRLDRDYANLESMLGIQPLKVTLLPAGSFQAYYNRKKQAGVDLAQLKPPHMNALDSVIDDLLGLLQDKTQTNE